MACEWALSCLSQGGFRRGAKWTTEGQDKCQRKLANDMDRFPQRGPTTYFRDLEKAF